VAAFQQLPSGKWRALVRRKGITKTKSFDKKTQAREWATRIESQIDQSLTGKIVSKASLYKLIDTFVSETVEKGRSRAQMLRRIQDELGDIRLDTLTQVHIQKWAEKQVKRSSAVTTASYLSTLSNVLDWGRNVKHLEVSGDICRAVRSGLTQSGHSTRSRSRDRIPTQKELDALLGYWDNRTRTGTPMRDIVSFAVASCMRQSEITRITFEDVNVQDRTVVIRQRKDPKDKATNDQTVPLIGEAWTIVERRMAEDGVGRIFKSDPRNVGALFRRACKDLKIEDLRFHDLRHAGITALFRQGLPIQLVSIVSGHKDWSNLKRYTQLNAADVHKALGGF